MTSSVSVANLMRCTGRTLRLEARRGAVVLLATLFVSGCGADKILSVSSDAGSRTLVATLGQEIQVTLGNVGPALYESPPQISSNAVTYLGVDVVPPYTPAGPRQRFRLRASSVGQAVVHFRRMLGDSVVSVVEDTIQVR